MTRILALALAAALAAGPYLPANDQPDGDGSAQSERPAARAFVSEDASDPEADEIFDLIRAGGREPANLHRALAVAPKVGVPVIELALAIRHSTAVDPRHRELMILRTVQLEGGHYEFVAHKKLARRYGMTAGEIDAIKEWQGSDLFDEKDRAVLAYADELAKRIDVPDAVFDRLRERFSPREIVELTIAAGFYTGMARITSGLDVALDAQ